MRYKQRFQAVAAALTLMSALVAAEAQQPTVQARAVRPAGVTGNLIDITMANDGLPNTRATSGRGDYVGLSVTMDVGGEQNIVGAIQDHGRWPAHYPGAYRVEVGTTEDGPWLTAFEGAGNRGESKAIFEAVRGRFIRITATRGGGGGVDWSVAELKAIIDPGATSPRRIPSGGGRVPDPPPQNRVEIRDLSRAFDKNIRTRATSGTPNYEGMSFTFDLGGEYVLSRVVQAHGQWREEYPAEYKVEVSKQKDESQFREIWRGNGEPGRSTAQFRDVVTRYVRVTALRDRGRTHWWSIAELRTNRDPDVIDDEDDDKRIDRPIRQATARGLSNPNAVLDDDEQTLATTNRVRYEGSFIELDMGGSYTISRVIQIHNPDDGDFPGRYRIEVSEDGRNWQTVWEGEGASSRSRANFTPVRARYVRVTATEIRRPPNNWSISKIRISG
ncbi:MAG TPA: discoidin domain-containing protein [Blastocatellia bacterium]|nr:discoidin domain-containing protein [Blastocatellia bacterium]